MVNHVQPVISLDLDERVLFSLFTCSWDDDVIFKNCARNSDHNKVYDYDC